MAYEQVTPLRRRPLREPVAKAEDAVVRAPDRREAVEL